eukprot:3686773-Rhodomonas_salina.2
MERNSALTCEKAKCTSIGHSGTYSTQLGTLPPRSRLWSSLNVPSFKSATSESLRARPYI